jgi:hypothetical protein
VWAVATYLHSHPVSGFIVRSTFLSLCPVTSFKVHTKPRLVLCAVTVLNCHVQISMCVDVSSRVNVQFSVSKNETGRRAVTVGRATAGAVTRLAYGNPHASDMFGPKQPHTEYRENFRCFPS